MTRLLFLTGVLALCGCAPLTQEYLNPEGVGRAYTVGNPCPYAYRVMEVRGRTDPDVRVTVGAFWKGEYQLKNTTLFVVVSDKEVMGYQVARFYAPPMKKERDISFPEGKAIKVVVANGKTVEGNLGTDRNTGHAKNTLILSFPISEEPINEFTIIVPPIRVDGELFKLGKVHFKRTTESWYVLNC